MYVVLRTCKSIPTVSWWRDLSVYKWPIPNNVTILAPYTCAASSPFASPSFSSRLYKCWGKFNKKNVTNKHKLVTSNCGQDNCRKLGSANLVWSKWGPSVAHPWPEAPDDRQMFARHPILHHAMRMKRMLLITVMGMVMVMVMVLLTLWGLGLVMTIRWLLFFASCFFQHDDVIIMVNMMMMMVIMVMMVTMMFGTSWIGADRADSRFAVMTWHPTNAVRSWGIGFCLIVIKIMVGSRFVVMRMKMTHPPTFGDKGEFVITRWP